MLILEYLDKLSGYFNSNLPTFMMFIIMILLLLIFMKGD